MEWQRDAARDCLMITLMILLLLSFAGLLVGDQVLKAPPREFVGRASGSVSFCMDDPPDLNLSELVAALNITFTYNVSENITSNPGGLPVYFYFYSNEVPNPNCTINWSTGIINFTPTEADLGIHLSVLCVTHDVCSGIEDCENITFRVTSGAPVWNKSIPDYEINESEVVGPDWFYNINDSIYVRNISLTDYVYDPDNQSMNFTALSLGEDITTEFPAFTLNSDTGFIEIIDADDVDYGNHSIRITATDESSQSNDSNWFTMIVLNTVNDRPEIYPKPFPHQYACEDILYNYTVNATDPDPDQDNVSFDYNEYGWTTFYMYITGTPGLIQFTPTAADVGDHTVWISAADTREPSLYDEIFPDYTVMEVNDYPNFTFNSTILPNTTEGHPYYFDLDAVDEEEINESSGNLTFKCNSSWINDSMNHTTGVVNVTVPDGVGGGTNNVEICVEDNGIDAHPNAESLCGEDGNPKQTCINTFVNIGNNTAPEILIWAPLNLTVRMREKETGIFWINFTDFENTSVHVYWFVNGYLRQYNISSPRSPYPINFFYFQTDYDSSGLHNITVIVNDGGFFNSITWEVFVVDVPAPVRGGGGGGGSSIFCNESWGCSRWTACQEMMSDIVYPLLGELLEDCRAQDVPEKYCGYQTRICTDHNNCRTTFDKPRETQGCYFVLNPNCYDGVKNCHHDDCEKAVDCGGPCNPCPSCHDGIQNQGERDVDCGGPCMPCRPDDEVPLPECGDKVCNLNELFSCPADCWVIWITIIAILTTMLSFKVGLGKIEKLKEKRVDRSNIERLEALSEGIERAIESKDIVLARKLYSKSRELFKKLPPQEKLRMYSKLTRSHSELKKYDDK